MSAKEPTGEKNGEEEQLDKDTSSERKKEVSVAKREKKRKLVRQNCKSIYSIFEDEIAREDARDRRETIRTSRKGTDQENSKGTNHRDGKMRKYKWAEDED